jgi:hypothetical protein
VMAVYGRACAPPRSALVMGFSGYPSRIIPAAVTRLAKAFEKRFEKPFGRQRRS